nr:element excision factor XisH family protein [Pseudanabaena sp. Chao 1811]
MPARDIYHNTVKTALEKDGWTITHDPFPLQIGKKRLSVDLGAERLISAEKNLQKIVVEMNHPAASGRGIKFFFTRIYSHRRAVGYLPS